MPTGWSYSGNPASSNLDGVRFLCQDTNPNDPQLSDLEINAILGWFVNIWRSAGNAAKQIEAKYARQVDKSVGDLHVSYSQRQKAYAELSAYLLRQADMRTSLPWAGGISHADKDLDRNNPDVVKPTFTKHQFQFPPVNTPDEGWGFPN